VNLWSYLGKGLDKQWISMSVCQTGDTDDFLRVGRAIGQAIAATDRKVILIATGSLSHTFYKLKELRKHEASDPSHIISQKARDMDHERLGWFFEGRHDRVLDTMPEFLTVRPEGMFAHYLMMAAALGEHDFAAPGVQYGDYENSIGTSQVHVWFDRPETGWTRTGAAA
jgi:aromatic ring-opening dioxygenase catalytic subunit (LigB family)